MRRPSKSRPLIPEAELALKIAAAVVIGNAGAVAEAAAAATLARVSVRIAIVRSAALPATGATAAGFETAGERSVSVVAVVVADDRSPGPAALAGARARGRQGQVARRPRGPARSIPTDRARLAARLAALPTGGAPLRVPPISRFFAAVLNTSSRASPWASMSPRLGHPRALPKAPRLAASGRRGGKSPPSASSRSPRSDRRLRGRVRLARAAPRPNTATGLCAPVQASAVCRGEAVEIGRTTPFRSGRRRRDIAISCKRARGPVLRPGCGGRRGRRRRHAKRTRTGT